MGYNLLVYFQLVFSILLQGLAEIDEICSFLPDQYETRNIQ